MSEDSWPRGRPCRGHHPPPHEGSSLPDAASPGNLLCPILPGSDSASQGKPPQCLAVRSAGLGRGHWSSTYCPAALGAAW